MKAMQRTVALIEFFLVFPAALFMGALFLRAVQPLVGSGRVVEWFSHHLILGLYVFLILMPLAALIVGAAMVMRSWVTDAEFRRAALGMVSAARAHLPALVIAVATVVAASILAMVLCT